MCRHFTSTDGLPSTLQGWMEVADVCVLIGVCCGIVEVFEGEGTLLAAFAFKL